MKIVLDTNVLVAALVADGLCRDLVRRRVRGHELCTSDALLKELTATLRGKFRVPVGDVPWLAEYRARATVVKAQPLPAPVCRDPDDDAVLATALAAQADAIIIGDDDLLTLKNHADIPILSPRQFLEHLDRL
ncbi:MAG: putative toxin-antitoxin system toxin component, PIN family [Opitutaceae bacterium]|nr:putative toxin-antitoxin system toxin component, PIN family [Opitutaceae bacterium]